MPAYLARMNGLLAQVEQEHRQVTTSSATFSPDVHGLEAGHQYSVGFPRQSTG